MSLMSKLEKFKDLTPDEIVEKLKYKGWVRGSNFTQADIDRMANKPCHLYVKAGDDRMVESWGPRSGYTFNWPLQSVTVSLKDYWFILSEEYENGSVPD